MTKYKDPGKAIAKLMKMILLCILVAAFSLCVGVTAILAYTALPEEDVLNLTFWPTVGVVSFGVTTYVTWITSPVIVYYPIEKS